MPPVVQSLLSRTRRVLSRLALLVVVGTFASRALESIRRRSPGGAERQTARSVLPSLFERHPDASRAPRRGIGLHSVELDRIVGTMRHPSQNTADFLPLPRLRGENWRARWQRITKAMDRLAMLPPVELVQVGEEYYVADGHNRVAAAKQAGAIEIDADVTQLTLPGVTQQVHAHLDTSALIGSQTVRQAAAGRMTRTVEQRTPEDTLSRQELARDDRPDV